MGRGDVLIDANNVRRSRWPNLLPEEVVKACSAWAMTADRHAHVIFDGAPPEPAAAGQSGSCTVLGARGESADDVIARLAAELEAAGQPYELVTSDRELRQRAGAGATRIMGGGTFLRGVLGLT